eukprot:TRINITY_DN4897_c1_g1_i4.p1 TRINITY_DN4897_c1_g1~~TRINITY_DN4897_c1_g1_i4.p1  ORF type:complete len:516 (-),score=116.91 TRINITY_DN4897_c1_g1_i4:35-1582(-)
MKRDKSPTVVSTNSPVLQVSGTTKVNAQSQSFIFSVLLVVVFTSGILVCMEYWRLHFAAAPVPHVDMQSVIDQWTPSGDDAVIAATLRTRKPGEKPPARPGRHQHDHFVTDPSRPDPNDPYFAGKSIYPAITESLRPFVGANYYCGLGSFGAGADCDQVYSFSKRFREHRSQLDEKHRQAKPDTNGNRTQELVAKPRKLKFFVDTNWWIWYQVFEFIDGSKCKFPIEVTHKDTENDLRLGFGGMQDSRAKHEMRIPYEPWDGPTEGDHISMGYHRKNDIWGTYWPKGYGTECGYKPECLFFPTYVDQEYAAELRKNRTSLAPLFISNCNQNMASPRLRFLAELARHIPLDSYGGCTPNYTHKVEESSVNWKRLIPGIENPTRDQKKSALGYTYNFSFAMENNIREDYVTEKFFNAIGGGNVMVVFGAYNVEEFAPAKHSFINALHFLHPRYLAAYIKIVNENEWIKEEFMKFRTQPIENPLFLDMQKYSLFDQFVPPYASLCRISERYAQAYGSD